MRVAIRIVAWVLSTAGLSCLIRRIFIHELRQTLFTVIQIGEQYIVDSDKPVQFNYQDVISISDLLVGWNVNCVCLMVARILYNCMTIYNWPYNCLGWPVKQPESPLNQQSVRRVCGVEGS